MPGDNLSLQGIPSWIADLLESKAEQYNQPGFIQNDPISIPHRYSLKQDIEIMGFWASILAWGQRKTIIAKCLELSRAMDDAPFDFIKNHQENDLKRFLDFKHRTFNATDTLYFIHFFKQFYHQHDSLEYAFLRGMKSTDANIEGAISGFHEVFTNSEHFPARTRKHIATPARKSSCKRLNMFLRWMVRKDDKGVDFGIWNSISPSQLVCPCDVHVDRVARLFDLIKRPLTDWQTAVELTNSLKALDLSDPVRYDFALFGLGIEGYASEYKAVTSAQP